MVPLKTNPFNASLTRRVSLCVSILGPYHLCFQSTVCSTSRSGYLSRPSLSPGLCRTTGSHVPCQDQVSPFSSTLILDPQSCDQGGVFWGGGVVRMDVRLCVRERESPDNRHTLPHCPSADTHTSKLQNGSNC